jgi:choline transport protein
MFNNATQNLAASDVMTTVLLVALAASGIASLAAASRQLWAFARSRGVPFSQFFAPVRIVEFSQLPASANFYRAIFHMIFLLIQFSSL